MIIGYSNTNPPQNKSELLTHQIKDNINILPKQSTMQVFQ